MLVSYSIQPRGRLQLASMHESAGYRILICADPLLQGGYDVQVVARSTEGEELMCVVVHFEMLVSMLTLLESLDAACSGISWLLSRHAVKCPVCKDSYYRLA